MMRQSRSSHTRRFRRLWLQALEDRTTPTTFVVTNTNDGPVSKAGDLPGSLRQAAFDANGNPGPDTITFDAKAFSSTQTITLTAQRISFNDPVAINGPGSGLLSISGNKTGAVMSLGGDGGTYSVSGLTLRDGDKGGTGGGMIVSNNSNVDSFVQATLTDCIITGNTGQEGGGIYAVGSKTKGIGYYIASVSLTLENCVFSSNESREEGGGISLGQFTSATIKSCTFENNTAKNFGGGIYSRGLGVVSIEATTISGNKSETSSGGGIALRGLETRLDLFNSTISGNVATLSGGGVYIRTTTATSPVSLVENLRNCTIVANEAFKGGGIYAEDGGLATITLNLDSTIIAENVSELALELTSDVFFQVKVTMNHCALGNDNSASYPGGNNLPTGVPLLLGPLADNGGPTKTHRPQLSSPLINAGSNSLGFVNDQRGPGFPRVNEGQPDIGAFEAPGSVVVTNDADSGLGSLRQAILNANADAVHDTITFDAGYYSVPRLTKLTTGELLVSNSLTIAGPGLEKLIISGNFMSRVFQCKGPGVLDVIFSGMTIRHGNVASGTGAGVLSVGENLTIQNCNITENKATAAAGIHVTTPGFLTVDNSQITSNIAAGSGGGIFTEGGISILGSVVSFNTAGLDAGGVSFQGNAAIRESTISNNTTGSRGGGIVVNGNLILENCTVSNNSAGVDGGGIVGIGSPPTFTIRNSTITANSANTGQGGGIARITGAGPMLIESSVVSGNSNSVAPDIANVGTVTLNFSAVGNSAGFSFTGGNNLPFGTNLKLGKLLVNGGSSLTMLPLAGSPLINAGSNPTGLLTDQRGGDFKRVAGGQADIGAAEVYQTFVVTTDADSGPGSLRQAALTASGDFEPDTITFDPGFFGTAKTIVLSSGYVEIESAVTILGPGADRLTIQGKSSEFVFEIDVGSQEMYMSGLTVTGGSNGVFINGNYGSISNCVIANNTGFAFGGGIFSQAIQLDVRNCTISGNIANRGGGIYAYHGLTIENSTISGNSAFGGLTIGGAIVMQGTGEQLTIRNSTITANQTKNGPAGGIRAPGANIVIASSIVSGNMSDTGTDIECGGTVNVNFSAIGSSGGFKLTSGANNLPFGADLKLGPLADNGGVSQTHGPQLGSPLVNAGSNPAVLTTDQRGAGFERVTGGQADIGALEVSQVLIVTNNADDGPGSLRQALAIANGDGFLDLVTFDSIVFATDSTITLTGGELTFLGPVSLVGPSAKLLTINGNNLGGVILVDKAATGTVISGLTITGANAFLGGGIASGADLTVIDCAIKGNVATATNGGGGGILSLGGSLTVRNSTISGNVSAGSGGGIGIVSGTLIVENSTISGNTSSKSGGGIALGTGSLIVRNSTITANSATNMTGGGVARTGVSGASSFTSSIVSGNTNFNAPDIADAGLVYLINCAVGSNTGFNSSGVNNLFGANLALAPLAYLGGPTQIHMPMAGSAAIDAGSNPLGFSLDQRGAGFARVVGAATDIGAVERQQLVVTTTADTGPGSLRQVIAEANTLPGPDSITFDPAVFSTLKSITLASGEIAINDPLTLTGPTTRVKLVGNGVGRVFNASAAPVNTIITLEKLEIAHGRANEQGGALRIGDEIVTVRNSIFTGNTAFEGGGAIAVGPAGAILIEDCTLSGNWSLQHGGAIIATGDSSVTVRRSTLSSNMAFEFGGAISTNASQLTIEESTLSNNTSQTFKLTGGGGGIDCGGSTKITISNSTISGNLAPYGSGGGISLRGVGVWTLQNSTISNNSAGAYGGGLFVSGSLIPPTFTLSSTIVAGNSNAATPDIAVFLIPTTIKANYNLIGVADVANLTLLGAGNVTGTLSTPVDAKLEPLANNGGPTLTHKLLPGSPARDAGSNPAGLTYDQRGPGFPRQFNTQSDIGSFESQVQFDYFWDGGGGGDISWHNPLNWNNDQVPINGSNVLIPVGFSVLFNANSAVVDNLTCEGSLLLSNKTLQIDGSANFTGAFNQTGGTLSGAGTVIIAGGGTLSGGTHGGNGKTLVASGSTWNLATGSSLPTLADRNIEVFGTVTWTDNGFGLTTSGGSFNVKSGGVFTTTSNRIWLANMPVNIEFGGLFTRTGTGATTFLSAFNNAGTVDVVSGTLKLGGGGSHSGTFNLTGGLHFEGGVSVLQNLSKVVGTGPLTVSATGSNQSVTFLPGSFLAGTSVLNVLGSTLNLGIDLVQSAPLNQSNGTITGSGNVTLSGGGTFSGGALGGTGKWLVPSGATWTMSSDAGGTLIDGRNIDVAGTLIWTGTGGIGTTGGLLSSSLTVLSGGVFDVQDNANWNGKTSITIAVGGLFRKSIATGTTQISSVPFNNAGTVEVLSGTLKLGGGGTHTGTFDLTGGLEFTGGTHVFQNLSKVIGSGPVTLSTNSSTNVSLTSGSSLSGAGILNVKAGTLNLAIDLNQAAPLNQTNGTITGSGNVTLAGGGTFSGGTLGGTGKWLIPNGATWTMSSDAGGTVIDGRNIDVVGTLIWIGTGGINTPSAPSSKLTVLSGGVFDVQNNANWNTKAAITIEAGGIFRKSIGTGTTQINFTQFSNNGTVEVLTGTLDLNGGLANFSGSTLNGGTFVVVGTLKFSSANIVTNQSTLTLDGPNATIVNASNVNALNAFATNGSSGILTIRNGHSLTVPNTFTNNGIVLIGSNSTLATLAGDYVQNSPGITVVDGTLAPAGAIIINGGSLFGAGVVQSALANTGGNIAPGASPGVLMINNHYTQSGAGKLNIELNGLTPGTQHDQLIVNGTVNLGGTLNVALGFDAKVGDSLVVLANDGTDAIVGNFSGLADGTKFTIGKHELEIDYQGDTGNDVTLSVTKVIIAPPPTAFIQVNDGAAQRSMVTSFKVSFSTAVTFPDGMAAAIQLVRTGPTAPTGSVTLGFQQVGNDVIVTFDDPVFASGVAKSLIDGNYALTLVAAKIQGPGGLLDGNGDGIAGDDRSITLHRLFGDADGNRMVNAADFAAFRSFFGLSGPSIFDFGGDGQTNAADFAQFRARFGITLAP